MHIQLTDALTCPRCGPEFGLIVLADRMDDRRIVEGALGCANCRDQYPIRGGVPELRSAGTPEGSRIDLAASDPDLAFRFAALLGVGEAGGLIVCLGASPELVQAVDALLPNARAIGAGRGPAPQPLPAGADWVEVGDRLPFRDHHVRGIVLAEGAGAGWVPEAARVLARGARIVAEPAPPDFARQAAAAGLQMLLEEGAVAVASDPTPG